MRPLNESYLVVVGGNGVGVGVAVSPSETILSIFERKSVAKSPNFPGIRSPRDMKAMRVKIRIKTAIAIRVHEEVFWDLIVDVLKNSWARTGAGDDTRARTGAGDDTRARTGAGNTP